MLLLGYITACVPHCLLHTRDRIHRCDISMLNGKVAAMSSCPANAIPDVQKAVRDAGGYVAQQQHGAGVCEALRYFVEG